MEDWGVAETAEFIGVGEGSVCRWITEGRLPAVGRGKGARLNERDVRDFTNLRGTRFYAGEYSRRTSVEGGLVVWSFDAWRVTDVEREANDILQDDGIRPNRRVGLIIRKQITFENDAGDLLQVLRLDGGYIQIITVPHGLASNPISHATFELNDNDLYELKQALDD